MDVNYFSMLNTKDIVEFLHTLGYKQINENNFSQTGSCLSTNLYKGCYASTGNKMTTLLVACRDFDCLITKYSPNDSTEKRFKKQYAQFVLSKIEDEEIKSQYKQDYNDYILTSIHSDLIQ